MKKDDISPPLTGLSTSSNRKSVRYSHNELMAHLIVKRRFKPNEYIYAKVLNISSNGAYINTGHKLSIKTKVTLNLMLPNQTIYKVTGRVVRIAEHTHYGVNFDQTQHALIDHIIVYDHNFSII